MNIYINRIDGDGSFRYDFDIRQDKEKEDVRDLHLFCLSVIKDLVQKKFVLKEYGNVSYDFDLDENDIKNFSEQLDYLSHIIFNERKKLDDDLKEMLE